MCEARTSPDSASETIQERALRSLGSTGAPVPRFTWVPAWPSCSPPTVDMFAGGVADGEVVADGVADGLASAKAGAVSERDNRVAEVTSKDRVTVLLVAGTVEKVQGAGREVPTPPHPGAGYRPATAILNP